MKGWPSVIAVENESGLSADQYAILALLASVETFFEEAGAPLTPAQMTALRSVEDVVRNVLGVLGVAA